MKHLKSIVVFLIRVLPSYILLKRTLRHPLESQRKYLIRLLKYCDNHNEYYKHFLSDDLYSLGTKDILNRLPLLTKDIIREEAYRIYSDEITKDYQKWANTGGSTGKPLCFPVLCFMDAFESANQLYLYLLMGWKLGDTIVSVDGSRIPKNLVSQNIFWIKGANFPYGKYSLSTLYMDNPNMEHYINLLNSVKPSIIRGYPSGVVKICRFIRDNKYKLDFSPKGVYLTSETITEEDKSLIQDTLMTRVWGQYGHTEASVFAFSYPETNEYRCSPYYGITEVLDSKGNHVNVGEQGEIVVTGFGHKGLPFIRYKTGDLAVYGGNDDGWVILSSLQGRSVDYIVNRDNLRIYLTGFIFGGHLNAFNNINDWQIKQAEAGLIEVLLIPSTKWQKHYEKELIDLFESKHITADIKYVDFIERSKRGKRQFMIQECH